MSHGLDTLVHRLRPADGEPQGALVLFHGRGTSEHDLFPLLDELDPERRLAGVTPRAPLSLPPGGAHWYVVRQVGYPDHETFSATNAEAIRFVDALPETLGVPLKRTVLAGFSQGAVMAYALSLGAERPQPAGILAMSGFIPEVEGFEMPLDDVRGLPVAITHGELDPVIGVGFGRTARERLEGAGAEVDYREAPIGHQIDPRWLPDLQSWLRSATDRARTG